MEKMLPPPIDAVKADVNRLLKDIYQQHLAAKSKTVAEPVKVASVTPVSHSAEQAQEAKGGALEFVSVKESTVTEQKKVQPADFIAALDADIRREFDSKLPIIQQDLQFELNKIFQQTLTPPAKLVKLSGKGKVSIDDLELVDDVTLTFRLVLDNFSSKVNEQFKIGIALTCLRLEKVLGFEIDLMLSPLGPYSLGSAIEQSLRSVDLDVGQKKQLLMAILKGLIVQYAHMLKSANDIFLKKSILPRLTDADAKARIDKYLRKIKAQEEGRDFEEDEAANKKQAAAAFARDFFQNIELPQSSNHAVVTNPNGPLIPKAHLLENIGAMQSVMVAKDEQSGYLMPAQTEGSFSELLAANTDVSKFALTAENSKTVGIISMLFDTLKNEETISPQIKALLLQLTVPLLKAAVQDDEFFSDKSNPAQVLFNSIAEASSSWSAESSVKNDFLYKKMSDIVQKVTDDYQEDYGVFESAVDDLTSYVDGEKQKMQRVEERIIANETAKARIYAARKVAQDHIFGIFGDFILDEGVKSFIDASWEQALFFIANNEGDIEESDHWQEATIIEKKLVSILDYERITETLDELFGAIIRLFKEVGKAESDTIKELEGIRGELQHLIDAAVEESPSSPPKPMRSAKVEEQKAQPAIVENIEDHELKFQQEQAEKMKQALANVSVGCWFEDRESSPQLKIKLAAHIKYTDTYVFVNRKGVKAASYDGPTLANMIFEKGLVIIDNSMLYDKSMENIIETLRA